MGVKWGWVGLVMCLLHPCVAGYFRSFAVIGDSVSLGYGTKTAEGTCYPIFAEMEMSVAHFASANAPDARVCSIPVHHDIDAAAHGEPPIEAYFNTAKGGAWMIHDAVDQAAKVAEWAMNAPRPLLVTLFLGHNDQCGEAFDRTPGKGCSSSQANPSDYCRALPDAFKHALDAALDVLSVLDRALVAVIAPIELSMVCSVGGMDVAFPNNLLGETCTDMWESSPVALGSRLVDGVSGLCGALTGRSEGLGGCSPSKIAALRSTGQVHLEMLHECVAGRVGVVLLDGLRLQPPVNTSLYVSDCDCFHPSIALHDAVADALWKGRDCSVGEGCCGLSSDGNPCGDRLDPNTTVEGLSDIVARCRASEVGCLSPTTMVEGSTLLTRSILFTGGMLTLWLSYMACAVCAWVVPIVPSILFALVVALAPLWFLNPANGTFQIVKAFFIFIPLQGVALARMFPRVRQIFRTSGRAILYLVLLGNVLVAVVADAVAGHWSNAAAGVALAIAQPFAGARTYLLAVRVAIETEHRSKPLAADLPIGYIALYTSWNLCFVFATNPAHFASVLAVLGAAAAFATFVGKDHWMQARMYTLAMRYALLVFIDVHTVLADSTSWGSPGPAMVWGMLNLVAGIVYVISWYTSRLLSWWKRHDSADQGEEEGFDDKIASVLHRMGGDEPMAGP
jgi:hypothetical protein